MVEHDFSDAVVLVTGGARGLGRSHVLAYAEAGADVAVLDVRDVDPVVTAARDRGADAVGLECDITDEDAVAAAVEGTVDALGGLDVLVNSAGVDTAGRLTDLDADEWDAVLAVNLTGTWLTAKHAARRMAESDGGCIVNTSSFLGHTAIPGLGAYSASKAGVNMLTRTLAQELAPEGVRCVAVSPIGVRTELVEERPEEGESHLSQGTTYAGRYNLLEPGERIEPRDVTEAVLWLSSDAARRITGVALPIDAGGLA